MITNRPDWCISRQRYWGVPLTILTCRGCSSPAIDESLFDHVRELFALEGADAWFTHPAEDLVPAGFACPRCGGTGFDKETDILDVWFDSGVSHLAVCDTDRYGLDWPADLYLEGQDQYRGWFQSSITAAVGLKGKAPYREVVTHGFVVDADGHKMSKSLGNTLTPQQLLKTYGADILRLWTAMVDFREDLRISEEIMTRNAEAYRKVRNTLRFLLGNLADLDPSRDLVPVAELRGLDGLILRRTRALAAAARDAYRAYDLSGISHRLVNFCTVDLSSLYLDVLKDRLYCGHPDDPRRRAAQTAIHLVAESLTTLLAPILSFTADEVWGHLPGEREPSVHLATFHDLAEVPERPEEDRRWDRILGLRETVYAQLERLRQDGVVGKSLEAEVVIGGDVATLRDDLEATGADLEELLIVSSVGWGDASGEGEGCDAYPGVTVRCAPFEGHTCARCWRRVAEPVDEPELPGLCGRCHDVVSRLVAEGRADLDRG
jgi:isoleucyl-tRNA synthetase